MLTIDVFWLVEAKDNVGFKIENKEKEFDDREEKQKLQDYRGWACIRLGVLYIRKTSILSNHYGSMIIIMMCACYLMAIYNNYHINCYDRDISVTIL